MLLDLVKAHAVLMQNQRERSKSGTLSIINATNEDFRSPCRLSKTQNGTDGGQQSKQTRKESELVEAIRSEEFTGITGGFGTGPCVCCGSKRVIFQERMTSARLNEPPQMNKKICRRCYERVLKAESPYVRVLPGVRNPGLMTWISTDLGRCQV
jgi:hypothetical protein